MSAAVVDATSLHRVKRRQALNVSIFLVVVAAATTGLFHVFRGDLVAYRRGETAFARRDFAVAAQQLERARGEGYTNPRARIHLAQSRLESGDKDAALVLYQEALAAAPRDESLIDTVAGLYQARGEPEKAVPLFAPLGAPSALSLRALVRLGDLHQQAGHYETALETYRLAAQRAPGEAELQLRIGIVLAWTGRRIEAATALRSAVELDPKQRVAQIYLARVLLWDGHFAQAVDQYRRVLAE